MCCNRQLAPGQWWNFCGETDMGQTVPVRCTECGGDMILADDPEWESKLQQAKEKWKVEAEKVEEERAKSEWRYHPTRWDTIPLTPSSEDLTDVYESGFIEFGYRPSFILIKRRKTVADEIESVLRTCIDPFKLALQKEQRDELAVMLKSAAEELAPNWTKPEEDWFKL